MRHFLFAVLTGISLYLSGEAFLGAAWAIVAANFPGMILEGLITAVAVMFLRKVKPELLGLRPRVE